MPAGVSGLPGTAVGGLRRGCSTSQMRFCFSHPERRGRQEISPCTAFLYWQNHQGAQICTSAAVEVLEQRNIGYAAPWITSESNISSYQQQQHLFDLSLFETQKEHRLFNSKSHTSYSITLVLEVTHWRVCALSEVNGVDWFIHTACMWVWYSRRFYLRSLLIWMKKLLQLL